MREDLCLVHEAYQYFRKVKRKTLQVEVRAGGQGRGAVGDAWFKTCRRCYSIMLSVLQVTGERKQVLVLGVKHIGKVEAATNPI